MRNSIMTCLAVASAMAGCTEAEIPNEHPYAVVTIEAGGTTYESEQGIEAGTATEIAVTLNGGTSSDDDGDIVAYRWIRTDVTAEARINGEDAEVGTGASVTVNLGVGKHRFSLWVTDDGGAVSVPATVTVSIVSAAACMAIYEDPRPGCAECVCTLSSEGGCRDEVTNCLGNPDPAFSSNCGMIVACAGATGCESAGCFAPDACMAELTMATADYGGFPGGCTDFGPSEAPCPASTAFGACVTANCADVCN